MLPESQALGFATKRVGQRMLPDPRRVIAKPYLPGEEIIQPGVSRAALLLKRIMAIPEHRLPVMLEEILTNFHARHRDFRQILQRHFAMVADRIESNTVVSEERKLLIGAYFTNEYSLESAALFNPSVVLSPDQTNLGPTERRLILSLRAVGEGHVSSIEFRTGIIDTAGNLRFAAPSKHALLGTLTLPATYDKAAFMKKLHELGVWNDIAKAVILPLPAAFSLSELNASLTAMEKDGPPRALWHETVRSIHVLATAVYVTTFPPESDLSERVLFPAGPSETRGMEDARFVRFCDGDDVVYYATYTAYDGFQIVPQLIETRDFLTFNIKILSGSAATNKGMALFPRKIGGRYAILSRQDRENLFIAFSDDVQVWHDAIELYQPSEYWELLHIGNCGSPLETEAGWLVIMHGVGPVRRYALGAMLLDLNDPSKVLGVLRDPMLMPDETEREGYVPNVLYSCGALINGDQLLLPYGFSDSGVAFALIPLPELLRKILDNPRQARPS